MEFTKFFRSNKLKEDKGLKVSKNSMSDDSEDLSQDQIQNYTKQPRRKSVLGDRFDPDEEEDDNEGQPVFHPKNDQQRCTLTQSLQTFFIFKHLDDIQKQKVIDAMFLRVVEPDERVITQGEDGDNLYVIETGIYDVYKTTNNKSFNGDINENDKIHQFVDSGCFGELALLYNVPRTATVISRSSGHLWAMSRHNFQSIVMRAASRRLHYYENLLASVQILSSLDCYERTRLADALSSTSYSSGQCIIKEGNAADGMYFIEDGQVRVTMKTRQNDSVTQKDIIFEEEISILTKGSYFGEKALVDLTPRTASVYSITPVRLAFLERDSFERLLGPCMDIMKRNMASYRQ